MRYQIIFIKPLQLIFYLKIANVIKKKKQLPQMVKLKYEIP